MEKTTQKLAHQCLELKFGDLPEPVVERIKYLLIDYLAVAVRGSLSESSEPVYRVITDLNQTGKGSVVIGRPFEATPPFAALANGTAAHSIEMDDVVNEASLHPAVTVMTTAFAVGSMIGCSGPRLMEAAAVGYEVTVKLGIALNPAAHYARGFHPTGTCGTMGSAVTAAKMLGADRTALCYALGIAGSQASGSMEYLSDGAFTKRFHGGWAAHSGIIAALLAQQGFTGPAGIIEGPFGFLHAYSSESRPEKVLMNWGDPFEVMNTAIKPHACCRYKQGPIDGILQIMNEHRLGPDDIKQVDLGVLKTGFPIVAEPKEIKYNPKSIVDAQFSMPFGAAVAVVHGKAGLDQYTREQIDSPEIKNMMARIHSIHDPDLEKNFPKQWPASVTITTKDGKRLTVNIPYPKGDPQNPLTQDELVDKFRQLTGPVLTGDRQDRILDRISRLEKEDDVRSFTRLLLKDE